MDLGIKNRVAIVAASSKGLGKAVALGLAREGVQLALCARTETTLNATVEEIYAATGVQAFARAVDVTSADQVCQFVRETARHFGKVDICVTNAGGPPAKTFAETTLEDWQAAANLNLMSTIYFAREVLPLMQNGKWGRFITITSAAVKQPLDNLILSNAVRAAVSGLVKSLSNEYAKDNILVNNVCPGYTLTARLGELSNKMAGREGVDAQQIQARWTSQIPMRRLGRPEEFAAVVVFLASECSSYITGASITVDGGLVKGIY
jgi:3-oxoacyl-[acyl-carrier protein] reductase